jgi:hypothetical protein
MLIFFDSLSCFIGLSIKNEHIDFVIMQKRRKMLEYHIPIDL